VTGVQTCALPILTARQLQICARAMGHRRRRTRKRLDFVQSHLDAMREHRPRPAESRLLQIGNVLRSSLLANQLDLAPTLARMRVHEPVLARAQLADSAEQRRRAGERKSRAERPANPAA